MSTFTESYVELMNLKNKEGAKLCVVITSYMNRALTLVRYFETYSFCKVSKHTLAQTAQALAPRGDHVSSTGYLRGRNVLRDKDTEYIIIEDTEPMPQGFDCYPELFAFMEDLSKETPIIFISKDSAEYAKNFNSPVLLQVAGCNERSLKIKGAQETTEDIYRRNCQRAVRSGIFYINDDFFDKFIQIRMEADALLEKGDHKEAMRLYYKVQAFHNSYAITDCPMNDFLSLTIYMRLLACNHFESKKARTSDFGNMLHTRVEELLGKLSTTPFVTFHATIYQDYAQLYKRFYNNSITRIQYFLFLNEYAF